MKPGKTYLPVASITSAPAGAARLRPIAAIVSPSTEDVGDVVVGGGDDVAVFDEQGHGGASGRGEKW